jgi:hypothetical protein
VGGIFNLLPILGLLAAVAAIYGFYLLWLGLPKLMKSPQEKTAGYFVVTIIAAILVYIVIGAVIGAVTATMVVGAILSGGYHI